MVLARAELSGRHLPTARVRRFYEAHRLPDPVELRVVGYHDGSSCQLATYDAKGERIFGSAHDSLEQAYLYAEWAFRVTAEDWLDVNVGS